METKQSAKNTRGAGPVWTLLLAVGTFFFGQFAGVLLFLMGTSVFTDMEDIEGLSTTAEFSLIVLIEIITLLCIYGILKYLKAGWPSIGLGRIKPVRDIGYAVLGYMAYFAILLFTLPLLKKSFPSLNLTQEQEVGFSSAGGSNLILVFLALVVLIPLAEEVLARGFLYTGLRRSWPKWLAMVVVSVLFGAVHLGGAKEGEPLLWIAAIDTFILSMVAITLKDKAGGSLWPAIYLHAIKNSIAFSIYFL